MFKFFATEKWYKKAAEQEAEHDDIGAGGVVAAPVEAEQLEDGSTYKVPLTTIVSIQPHTNAERLELAFVYGFQVVVQKGKYQVGDKVIYIPIDSLLPEWLETKLFPEGSKIKLHNHRVRQIRIRQLASQGMIIDPVDVTEKVNPEYLSLEQNLAAILGVTKYEPPQPGFANTQGKDKQRNKKYDHPLFHKYNGLDNIKWFPSLFLEGDEVVLQEKLHGTNARASVLPFIANTWMKKLKRFFGLAPKVENCYGSNNVDISASSNYKGFYGEDIYGACLNKLGVFDKLKLGEIVFGEIVGPSIQKNYDYGLTEHHFVVFDVKVLQPDQSFKWMNPEEVEAYCLERGFEFVPVLYKGPYNKELTYSLTRGPSLYGTHKVREGLVIKSRNEYNNEGNKKALKWVNEDYLDDKNNTDFH
jgi:RNA ligase (TIGR02306 family)